MRRILVYISAFVLSAWSLSAADESVLSSFKSVSMEDGLTSNKISTVVKDSLGTLWVGTYYGLNRIVENEIVRYNNDFFYGKEIHFMFTDRNKGLWISSEAGLFKYDYSSDTFSYVTVDGIKIAADSYDLTDDGILFGTNMGIVMWSYASCSTEVVVEKYGERFRKIRTLDKETAIVSIDYKGIYKVCLDTGETGLICGIGNTDFVTSSLIDSCGRLWVALYGKGLRCISTDNGEVLYSRPSLGTVLDIKEYDGKIWFGTDGDGIGIIDREEMSYKEFPAARDIHYKLRVVSCIYREGNNLWIGTVRHGLQCLSERAVRHISGNNILNSDTDKDFAVQCFCENEDGTVFVGTDGSGLYTLDPGTNDVRLLPDFKDSKIVSVEFADNHTLLLSTYGDGIWVYDIRTREMERIPICDEETDKDIFSKDCIVNICRGYDGRILLFTDVMFCFDSVGRRISRYEIPGLEKGKNFREFRSDSGDMLLVSNTDVFKINRDMSATDIFHTDDFVIYSIALIKNILWVSDGYNLYKINTGTGTKDLISELGHDKIHMTAADGEGNLWVIKYDKFIRISQDGRFQVFDHSDGVMSNDYFYPATIMISREGELYLGGNYGFNIINLSRIGESSPVGDISLVSISVDGESYAYEDVDNHYKIAVPCDYGFVEIRMAVSGSNVFKEHNFKYEIRKNGRRGKVVKVLYGKTMDIPLLASGKYQITIYVEQEPGGWYPVPRHISFVVRQSAYRRILQLSVLYIIILVLVTFAVFIYFRREKRKSEMIFKQKEKELSENKISFFINMSHELRTPLTLIYAPLKRIIERENLPDEYRDDLKPVYRQTLQMIRIINMILDFKKLEEGYTKLIVSPVKLNEWAKIIADDFKMEYEAKGIGIRYEFDDSIGMVNLDEGKCSMALSNLMMNAYKYSPAGTVVTVSTVKEGDFVKVAVSDQGIGISGVDVRSLFKRFRRNTSFANGFGLGLAYTKQIIEAQGGDVGAEPASGTGSEFYFRIPCSMEYDIAEKEDAAVVQDIPDSEVTDFDTSGITALVADDDPELLAFMKTSLADSFKEIVTASDGAEAYAKTQECSPGIIISDVMMPEMNGYELCRSIKNNINISHIPVILLTAQADMAHRTEGYKSGADVFISKPFDISGLMVAVKTTLSNREIIRNRYKTDFVSVSADSSSFSSADEQFLTKMEKFIMDNLEEDSLDAPAIIEYMCMSRSNFYKKMKELTGIGVKEYVNQLRMKKAAELLHNTEKQIAEIAREVGFSDNLYFSKVFKAHYGISPTAYRKTRGL